MTSLSIAEAAEQTGLTAHTLRYYERDGLLLHSVERAPSGHRRYTDDDLRWIQMVTRLRAPGMGSASLDGPRRSRGAPTGGPRADPRRLLVNVVVATDVPFVAETWVGRELRSGDARCGSSSASPDDAWWTWTTTARGRRVTGCADRAPSGTGTADLRRRSRAGWSSRRRRHTVPTDRAASSTRARWLQHLDAFRGCWMVVPGTHTFARQLLATDVDLTGGAERPDNEKGLEDARRRLATLGVEYRLTDRVTGRPCPPTSAPDGRDRGHSSVAMDSHAVGETTPALLEETIGACLTRTVAAHPDHEALVEVSTGRRWTWAELDADVRRLAMALLAGGTAGRPGRDLGPQLRRVDHRPARHRPHRRRAGDHQPGLPHPRAGVRAQPGRHQPPVPRRALQDQRLRRDARRGPRAVHRPDRRAPCSAADAWDALLATGDAVDRRRPRGPRAGPRPRPADQHPVHLRHHRLPQGRDPEPPQHPQQRLVRRRGLPLHPRGPDLHPGALLPLLRDGDGQPRGPHPRRHDGHPGARLRPRADARRGRAGALHQPVRRPHDVHRRVGAAGLRVVRPVDRPHRHHGRLAVPRRDDAQAHRRRHHRDDHLLRHDRDVARSPPRPAPTTTSTSRSAPSAASARTSRSRSSTRSPARRCRAARPASWRPRATR